MGIRSLRENNPSCVRVKLRPGNASWSFTCVLSKDAVQRMEAAPSASNSVRLVVDRLVCKISKPRTSKISKPRTSKTPFVPHELEVWATVSSDGDLRITDARGSSQQLVDAFRETDLRSWVHPREDFDQVLWPVFSEHGDEDVAMPFELGTYTFRNPDQCPLPVNFEAVVTLVERDDGQAEDALLYFTLSICPQRQVHPL